MTGFTNALRRTFDDMHVTRPALTVTLLAFLACAFFPSNLPGYAQERHAFEDLQAEAHGVDRYVRFVNTVLEVATPILLADTQGLAELAVIAVWTTAATHGTKYLLNDVKFFGVRLGERPSGPASHDNMPSGHSSLAASAVWFLGRRYGAAFLWTTLPVLLLTCCRASRSRRIRGLPCWRGPSSDCWARRCSRAAAARP